MSNAHAHPSATLRGCAASFVHETADHAASPRDLVFLAIELVTTDRGGPNGELPLTTVAQTYVFNLSGHPAVSVPAGMVAGTPIGLQIVGRRHDDLRVLAAAARLEALQPWPLLAPAA